MNNMILVIAAAMAGYIVGAGVKFGSGPKPADVKQPQDSENENENE